MQKICKWLIQTLCEQHELKRSQNSYCTRGERECGGKKKKDVHEEINQIGCWRSSRSPCVESVTSALFSTFKSDKKRGKKTNLGSFSPNYER